MKKTYGICATCENPYPKDLIDKTCHNCLRVIAAAAKKHEGVIIAFDLDGTLAVQAKHYDPEKIGPPAPPDKHTGLSMVDRAKKAIAAGKPVWILTARMNSKVSTPAYRKRIKKKIEAWCEKWIGKKLPITSEKHPAMAVMYDDRNVRVQKNTSRIMV